jgi:uncharacterized coiled-coil DUF342 family protein
LKDLREFSRRLDEVIGESTRELERVLPKLEREMRQFEGRLRHEAPVLRQRLEELLKRFKDGPRHWEKQGPKRRDVMV